MDPWAILRDLRAIELLDELEPDQLEMLPVEVTFSRMIPPGNFPRPCSCEE